jgi:hypothetical protein
VAANDGRTVSFGYTSGDVTSALLASATLPGGATTKFEWSGTGQDAQVSTAVPYTESHATAFFTATNGQ